MHVFLILIKGGKFIFIYFFARSDLNLFLSAVGERTIQMILDLIKSEHAV